MKWEWVFLASALPLWVLGTAWGGWLEKRFPSTTETKTGQVETLEVLRGIAAFVVFLAHVTMYFGALAPGSRASSYFGDLGVIIFFMLTGFLFWGQILSGRLNLDTFFQKRVKRLVPLCLFVVATVTLIDWLSAGLPWPNGHQVQAGLRNFGFGFVPVADVFTPDMQLRINTIWSLKWEWLFYLCLPLFAVKRSWWVMIAGAAAIAVLFYDVRALFTHVETEACFVVAFLLGALGNLITPGGAIAQKLGQPGRRLLALVLLIAFVALSGGMYFYEGAPEARVRHLEFVLLASMLFFFFPLLAEERRLTSGWFGHAAMHLGRISYSLYLWQLAVIYYVIRGGLKGVALDSGLRFGLVVTALTLLVVAVSHFSYRHVELPFMRTKRG